MTWKSNPGNSVFLSFSIYKSYLKSSTVNSEVFSLLVKAMQTLPFCSFHLSDLYLIFSSPIHIYLKMFNKRLLQKFSETVSPLLQASVIVTRLQKVNNPIYLAMHLLDILSNPFHLTLSTFVFCVCIWQWAFLFNCTPFPTYNLFQTCFTLNLY